MPSTAPARFHSHVVRELDDTYTIIYGERRPPEIATGYRSRDEALGIRDSLRRGVAAAGVFVHTDGCCGRTRR